MTRTMVLPSAGTTRLRPLDAAGVRVTGGFWRERLDTNRGVTIPHGLEQLEASGALGNFRNAARDQGRYIGGSDDGGSTFPFLDSDVYKWLEAVGWELGREADPDLAAAAGDVIEAVAAAQRADGYLGTYVRLSGREPYSDLAWGHELYCVGHLIQAAVAWQRSLGDERLTAIVGKAMDHIESVLGAGRREGIDGHPEIEMALVELFRTTGEERYLAFAKLQLDRRGQGLLGSGRLGTRYWQDHAPVREAPTVVGHAVRQLYLESGAVDVAVETGDRELLDAVIARWSEMWASRTYLTGALGPHHRDEAFGDRFELPSDRAYAETCAAIANVMLSWRLFLATGEARYADAIERTLYNAVLPGLSLDGTHFFYTNPLQRRDRPGTRGAAAGGRVSWYPCACCPPNLMRTLSSFEHLIAATDDEGINLQQLASVSVQTALAGETVELRMETDQPWQGRVEVEVAQAPERPWALRIRVPSWARSATLRVGDTSQPIADGGGWATIERSWQAGDRVTLDLPSPVRLTTPDRRIDAVRGSVAVERGPLVYCLEQVDIPDGTSIEQIELDAVDPGLVADGTTPESLPGMATVEVQASAVGGSGGPATEWPYGDGVADAARTPTQLTMIPYFAWANRTPGPMRVWVPVRQPGQIDS